MDFSLAAEILAEMLTYIVDDAKKHAPNRHFASGQDSGGCAIGLPRGATDICGAGTAEMCGGGAVEICGAGATWGTGAAGGAARGHVVFR